MIYKLKSIKKKLSLINKDFSFFFMYKRKIFNTRGYCVHSPYIYEFIHRVIKNKTPYYCFDSLWLKIKNELNDSLKISNITKKTTFELIFRIVDSLALEKVHIITNNTENNLLNKYIERLNCSVYLNDKIDTYINYDGTIIVFEVFKEELIDYFLNKKDERIILIFIAEKSDVRKKIKEKISYYSQDLPTIIELNNLDIWFLGYNISNKRIKLYYK